MPAAPTLSPLTRAWSDSGRYVEIQLTAQGDPQRLLHEAAGRLRLSRFELVEPSLHDIFVASVTGRAGPQAP